MNEPKPYDPQNGVMLDGNFMTHASNCEQCKRFDEKQRVTIGLMCLEGSVLWKRENAVPVSRGKAWQPDTVRSKKEVKRAMKYK